MQVASDEQIAFMYREGMSIRDVASALNVSKQYVEHSLRKQGIERRTKREAALVPQAAFRSGRTSPHIEREVVARYLSGEQVDNIAESFGNMSTATVYAILRRHGIEKRGDPRRAQENPIAREGEGEGGGLVCMGRKVELVMKRGRNVRAKHPRDGMLYDETGTYWPKCSLLITSFENGTATSDESRARDFFGRKTKIYEGHASLPPKSINEWDEIGEVKTVFYDRAGKYEGPFRHEFNKPRGLWVLLWPIKRGSDKPAVLFQRAESLRIELPEGCIVDDRGIVVP